MKKLVYILIALLVFGGVAFVLTQTSLLGGNFGRLGDEKTLETVNPALDFGDIKTNDGIDDPVVVTPLDSATTDTDGDGLMDEDEVNRGTDFRNPDSDGDGLLDGEEVGLGTDPLNKDTDNGGVEDGSEVNSQNDPLDGTDDTQPGPVEETAPDTDGEDLDEEAPVEEVEPEQDKETVEPDEGTYACTELNIKPDSYELRLESEDVEFTVELSLDASDEATAWQASYFSASSLAFTLPSGDENLRSVPGVRTQPFYKIDTIWEGTLIVSSDGEGRFYDPLTGESGKKMAIVVSYYYNEIDLVYTDGSVGDTITAVIEEEPDCEDTLPLTSAEDEKASSFVCSDVSIIPDTYTLPSGETTMDFEVEVTSVEEAGELSWKSFFKNLMAFTLILPTDEEETDEWSGKLLVETDGDGTLSTPESDVTGSEVLVAVSGESTTVPFNYEDALAGDTIMASIVGEEKECTDVITLEDEEETEVQVEDEEGDTATSTTQAVTEEEEEEVATTTTTQTIVEEGDEVATTSYDFDEILTSKDYVCTEPFKDVGGADWFFGNLCRLYKGGIVQGYDATTAGPEKNMTRAEALKVLLLLAGHDVNEAYGYTEYFSDVSSQDWYYPYYVIAEKENIVHAGSMARPNDPVTRGDFMVTMARIVAADTNGVKGTLYGWDESDIPFSDLTKSDYYTYSIIIGYNTIVDDPDEGEKRVFEGYSNGTSGATKYIARSEAVTLALRFYLAWYAK